MSRVSATEPDWHREVPENWWDPSRHLLRAIRDYQALGARRGLLGLRRKWIVLRHQFWSLITQAEIPLSVQIGGGLRLPHPNGIVIHPNVVMGPNCMIFQQVNLGSNRGSGRGRSGTGVPVIGGHVDIGPGARLLGGITIGDHAVIGANAVVLQDVPPGATAVGVPARILPPKEEG